MVAVQRVSYTSYISRNTCTSQKSPSPRGIVSYSCALRYRYFPCSLLLGILFWCGRRVRGNIDNSRIFLASKVILARPWCVGEVAEKQRHAVCTKQILDERGILRAMARCVVCRVYQNNQGGGWLSGLFASSSWRQMICRRPVCAT